MSCFCQQWCHHTCRHHYNASQMRWYASDNKQQFLFFYVPIILMQVDLTLSLLHIFFKFNSLVNCNVVLPFLRPTSCGKPSLFTLVNSSPDCWLQHRHTYLLEGVIWQTVQGVFLHQGKNSSVIHHNCFLWSSWFFDVPELTNVFSLFKNVPNSWFSHT